MHSIAASSAIGLRVSQNLSLHQQPLDIIDGPDASLSLLILGCARPISKHMTVLYTARRRPGIASLTSNEHSVL